MDNTETEVSFQMHDDKQIAQKSSEEPEQGLVKSEENVFDRLRYGIKGFSSMQQQVCSYILENYQKVAFLTVEALSLNCGVSPATVVRTVKTLGYASYKELQSEFENLIMNTQVSLWWELERSWEGDEANSFPLKWVAEDNVAAIQESITPQIAGSYLAAVDMLAGAEKVCILGMRSSRAASLFFHSMLNQLLPNVTLAPEGADTLYDNLVDLGPKDLLFCISLGGPHYAKTTAAAISFAAQNKIPTILVTSSPGAPAVATANLCFFVASTTRHYSLVPCLTLLESLVVSVGQRCRTRAQNKLRKLEKVLANENVTF